MPLVRRFLFTLFIVAATGLRAQLDSPTNHRNAQEKVQEEFGWAVAQAHARTNLFYAGAPPFMVSGEIESRLATHAVGHGTYENKWVDEHHWQRNTYFEDFQQTAMRNGDDHPWIVPSQGFVPIRAMQAQRFILLHVPSITEMASFSVVQATSIAEDGSPLTCYSTEKPIPADGFPRRYGWCFQTKTGLLYSEDLPLAIHIVFSNYIPFLGKQEFTHVSVKAGVLPILEMNIHYAPLDSNALLGLTPVAGMKQVESVDTRPNPEEWGPVEILKKSFSELPADDPGAKSSVPTQVYFLVGKDGQPLDVAMENASTEAMANATLKTAAEWSFGVSRMDSKSGGDNFYYAIGFEKKDSKSLVAPLESAPPTQANLPGGLNNVYSNKEHSYTFRFPSDFQIVPQEKIREYVNNVARQHGLKTKGDSLECSSLLLQAYRFVAGNPIPEVMSLYDLDESCRGEVMDDKELRTVAVRAAHNLSDKLKNAEEIACHNYKVDRRLFVNTFTSATLSKDDITQPEYIVTVTTELDGHILCWTMQGPDADSLKSLAGSSLQVGSKPAYRLIPAAVIAHP
jgi:hypothetical protein